MDIIPEISQYAQAAGIDLQLTLAYPSELRDHDPNSKVRLSPFFGLTDEDDPRLGWERVKIPDQR